MEMSTQMADRPVLSPRILGPRMLPSNCCKPMTKAKNRRAAQGSTITRINRQGMAPMMGPKKGITLVTPTVTLTSMGYGIWKMAHRMKQSTPMMAESMILPLIKPTNTRLAWPHTPSSQSDRRLDTVA